MAGLAQLAASVGRRWLRQIVAQRTGPSPKYKQLVIFDFDGTTFRSPQPSEGYDKPREEWWSDPVSLSPPNVDEKPDASMWHPDTVDRMKQAIDDPDSYVVVMTGRHTSLKGRLQELLDGADLKVDELITNPEIGNTSQYKRDEMLYLLRQLPNVREVEFWEDKKADLKGYQRAAEKAGMRFTPKLVKNYEDETPPYVGVFLTPDAKRKLLEDFPPAHSDIQADHVTLMFKPTQEEMQELQGRFKMGQRVPIKVTGVAQDDKAQALSVELPGDFEDRAQRKPHVTISVAEGVSPMHSNDLLAGGSRPIEPRTYTGYLDVGPRPSSPGSKQPKSTSKKDEKKRIWLEYLQTETRNPNYGQPGHHKERVLRKTLYDAGGAGRRQVMREWGPYLQHRRR